MSDISCKKVLKKHLLVKSQCTHEVVSTSISNLYYVLDVKTTSRVHGVNLDRAVSRRTGTLKNVRMQ